MKIVRFFNFVQNNAFLADYGMNQSNMVSVDEFFIKKYTDLTVCLNLMNQRAMN